MPEIHPAAWLLIAFVGAACVVAMLRAVASSIDGERAAHDLAIRVARLRIRRLEQLREFERQRTTARAD